MPWSFSSLYVWKSGVESRYLIKIRGNEITTDQTADLTCFSCAECKWGKPSKKWLNLLWWMIMVYPDILTCLRGWFEVYIRGSCLSSNQKKAFSKHSRIGSPFSKHPTSKSTSIFKYVVVHSLLSTWIFQKYHTKSAGFLVVNYI